jgi:DNA-binding transcriptional regulator YiaG
MAIWTPDLIKALRKHLGLNQSTYGEMLGYGGGAQARVSDLERGAQDASGPLVPLLDCLADKHGFTVEPGGETSGSQEARHAV